MRARNPKPGEYPQRVALERRTTREGDGGGAKNTAYQGTEQRPERRLGSRKEELSSIADVKGSTKA